MKLSLPDQLRRAATQAPVEVQDEKTDDRFYLMSRGEWERIQRLLEAEEIDPSFYEATDIEVFGTNDQ